MEQQKASTKPMSKILKFLPRASSVSFQNPPIYSPGKDKRSSGKTHKSNLGIGFSGPMVSMIPTSDTRRKIKNDSNYTIVYEPTSPRVSCMGQVKCKHYRNYKAGAGAGKQPTNNKVSRTTSFTPARTYEDEENREKVEKVDSLVVKNKKKSGIRGMFRGGARGKKSGESNDKSKTETLTIPKAPCLSTMKRFSSGRDAFTNFDWTTQVAPLDSGHRNCFTDDESDGEEIRTPSSAPVMVRNKDGVCDDFVRVGVLNLEPRKEINLWKRRTMCQPKPLQLHAS